MNQNFLLAFNIGKDKENNDINSNLEQTGNIKLFGEPNSGKTNFIQYVLYQLIQKNTKDELKMLIYSPKAYEYDFFNGDDHFINDEKNVINNEEELCNQLDNIYKLVKNRLHIFVKNNCKDIFQYNKKEKTESLNYVVVILEEFVSIKNIESFLSVFSKILPIANRCGIYFITANYADRCTFFPLELQAQMNTYIYFGKYFGNNFDCDFEFGLTGINVNDYKIINENRGDFILNLQNSKTLLYGKVPFNMYNLIKEKQNE